MTLKSNSEITKFIGKNIVELRELTSNIKDGQTTIRMIENELKNVGDKVLSDDVYTQDGERVIEFSNHYWGENEVEFEKFLKARANYLKDSEFFKVVYPDYDVNNDWSKCYTYKFQKEVNDLESELINKFTCVLGFGTKEVKTIAKRKEILEILTGLIKHWSK